MHPLRVYVRAYLRRKHVRPWALSAPVIVLLICLPLLRPLRRPLLSDMSDEELARYGTVVSLVDRQTFAIDHTPFEATRQKLRVGDAWYANQPPVMALLLAGPYWVMRRYALLSFTSNPAMVEFLLTLVGVTVPVAAAAGMLYRMNRVFELTRPWRAGLALAVVLGSGLVSYATVLNAHAPAAALVLLSAAILVQVSFIRSPLGSGGYLIAAGLFAALAAAVDPIAIVFTILLAGMILTMRWRWSMRVGGILLYCIGMLPPIMLHVALSGPITGDWRLGLTPSPVHVVSPRLQTAADTPPPAPVSTPDESTDPFAEQPLGTPPTLTQRLGTFLYRSFGAFLGDHGLLSHFPVLIFGVAGLSMVLRRHWPITAKALAIITAAGAALILLRCILMPLDARPGMFANSWYIVFLPLALFWIGAFVRRSHHPATWSIASVLLAFSIIASLIGATDPMPRDGYDRYTLAAAAQSLIHPAPRSPLLAGR